MKKVLITILFALFIFSANSFAANTLMHESHEKLRQAQQEMEVIKKTEDPIERVKLLDQHTKTMQEFSDSILQVQHDPKRANQDTIMTDIMFERVRYLEQMMQQLLANQSERSKIESVQ